MQTERGRVQRTTHEPVEGHRVLVAHLARAFGPQRVDVVRSFAVERDGEADEGGVLSKRRLHRPLRRSHRLFALFDVEHDTRAARRRAVVSVADFARRDDVFAVARATPSVPDAVPDGGEHVHSVGHHERRVKTHTELTDDVRGGGVCGGFLRCGFAGDALVVSVCRVRVGEVVDEGFGAASRDDAEIGDEVVARHAEAVVLDDETAALVVDGDVHGELAGVLAAREVVVAALLERVAGVGDELAHKHLLVAVQGVGDDVQEASRLCLERVRLLARGGGVRGEGTRGAESGHRNASARADENVPRARARDGTRDDGGDGGGAPSGIRSRGIRERDARGGRDGRGGAQGRRQRPKRAVKRARARHRLSEHERGSQEGRAAPIWRAREPSAGFLSRREGGHPSVHVSSVLASSAKIWWEGSHGSVFARRVGVVSRIRTRFTRTSFKQKARRSTSTIDRRRRRTVPSYGSADDPPRRRRLGRRRRHRSARRSSRSSSEHPRASSIRPSIGRRAPRV